MAILMSFFVLLMSCFKRSMYLVQYYGFIMLPRAWNINEVIRVTMAILMRLLCYLGPDSMVLLYYSEHGLLMRSLGLPWQY